MAKATESVLSILQAAVRLVRVGSAPGRVCAWHCAGLCGHRVGSTGELQIIKHSQSSGCQKRLEWCQCSGNRASHLSEKVCSYAISLLSR